MKTINACFLGILLFTIPASVLAFGTFELLDSKTLPNAIVGQSYTRSINFVYSGDWFPSATMIGSNLPAGMKLSSVFKKSTGLYYVSYSGTPTYAGQYSLKLLLTDDNGGSLIQDINFEVTHSDVISILETSFPIAKKDKDYSAYIKFKYYGSKPSIGFTGNYPEGISSEIIYGYPDTTLATPVTYGSVVIKGVLKKAGTYDFTLNLNSGDFNRDMQLQIAVVDETKAINNPPIQQPLPEIAIKPKLETTIKKETLPASTVINKKQKAEVTQKEVVSLDSTSTVTTTIEAKPDQTVLKNKSSFLLRTKAKIKETLINLINRL